MRAYKESWLWKIESFNWKSLKEFKGKVTETCCYKYFLIFPGNEWIALKAFAEELAKLHPAEACVFTITNIRYQM